jgi:hypothetical protein
MVFSEVLIALSALAGSSAAGATAKAIADILRREKRAEAEHHRMIVQIDGRTIDLANLSQQERDDLAENLLSIEPESSSEADGPADPTP